MISTLRKSRKKCGRSQGSTMLIVTILSLMPNSYLFGFYGLITLRVIIRMGFELTTCHIVIYILYMITIIVNKSNSHVTDPLMQHTYHVLVGNSNFAITQFYEYGKPQNLFSIRDESGARPKTQKSSEDY